MAFLFLLDGCTRKGRTKCHLCPVDLTIVPCGYGGEGYRLRKTFGWVEKLSHVLQAFNTNIGLYKATHSGVTGDSTLSQSGMMFVSMLPSKVAMVTAKVVLKPTSGLGVDLSDFLKDMQDELVDELVDRILGEDALFRVVSGEEDIGANMQTETMASHAALKTFMDKKQRERRKTPGMVMLRERKKMKRLSDGSGGMVWVRNKNVQGGRSERRPLHKFVKHPESQKANERECVADSGLTTVGKKKPMTGIELQRV
ncbi:unnamed protein product [Ectocarpus sp. CCAP 1310/34]|nr:unnamed protein product [Ectocarpus sp. CCAP 1310/34]